MKAVLYLIFFTLIFSCSKENDDAYGNNNSLVTPTNDPSKASFSAFINGQHIDFIEGPDFFSFSLNNESAYGNLCRSSFMPYLTPSSGVSGNTFFLAKGYLIDSCGSIDLGKIKNFFQVSTYPYSLSGNNGIELTFVDANQINWSTSKQSCDQTNSTFAITESKIIFDTLFQDSLVLFKAQFNCKLYNDSNATVNNLTDGVFVGKIWNVF
jgi:hypothetical protein